jgi:CRISPR-associated endoribonuclease Cas6
VSGPYAVVIPFSSPVKLTKLSPEVIHAAFLSLVRRGDPALAKLLHSPRMGSRPFSLSTLGYPGRKDKLSLRLGILDQSMFDGFWRTWKKRGGLSLTIGRNRLRPLEIKNESPWISVADWAQMLQQPPPKEIKLFFCTPTAFRQGDIDLPLPVPHLVFCGLLARWNAFSPLAVPLSGETIERKIALSYTRIRTRTFFDGRTNIPGFVGEVTFRILRNTPSIEAQAIAALADFSFYAGVGRKTTHGMGLVRRLT